MHVFHIEEYNIWAEFSVYNLRILFAWLSLSTGVWHCSFCVIVINNVFCILWSFSYLYKIRNIRMLHSIITSAITTLDHTYHSPHVPLTTRTTHHTYHSSSCCTMHTLWYLTAAGNAIRMRSAVDIDFIHHTLPR